MKKSRIAFLLLGVSPVALTLPVWAQSTDQGTETVTVTGSRVARQGFEAPTPTTAIGSVELEQKAALTVTDIIAEIPSLAPNQNNNNSQNIGLSTFNLRNIGPTRTLVLIDGMRVEEHQPHRRLQRQRDPRPADQPYRYRHGRRFRRLWLGRHHRCRQRVARAPNDWRQDRPAGHRLKLW